MDSLREYIEESLRKQDPACTYEKFQSLVVRLFNQQSLWGSEHSDKREQHLYNVADQVYHLLSEVMEVMGCQLYRNSSWKLIYLMPGSATHALFEEPNDEVEENYTFKRLNKQETMIVICLRYLYQQSINNGELVGDRANVSIGDINHTLHSLFGQYLPDTQQGKINLFRTLKKIRLVDYKDLISSDDIVAINVMILLYDLSSLNATATQKIEAQSGSEQGENNEA